MDDGHLSLDWTTIGRMEWFTCTSGVYHSVIIINIIIIDYEEVEETRRTFRNHSSHQ